MPAISGSPTQISTSEPNVAALESVEISQFQNGDLAVLAAPPAGGGPYYFLDSASVAARDGSLVLYTRNSNPAYGGSGAGRWLRSNIAAAGSPDEIAAEDVTYNDNLHPPLFLGATNVQSAIDVLKGRTSFLTIGERVIQQIPIPVGPPEPNLIESTQSLTTPVPGQVAFDVQVSVSNGAASPTNVTLRLRYRVNGGPPVDEMYAWPVVTVFAIGGRASVTLRGTTPVYPLPPLNAGDVITIIVAGSADQVGAQIENVSFIGRFY